MKNKPNFTTHCLIVGEFLDDPAFTQTDSAEQENPVIPSRVNTALTDLVAEITEDARFAQILNRTPKVPLSSDETLLLQELMKEWKGSRHGIPADAVLRHLDEMGADFPVKGIGIRLGLASLELKGMIQSTPGSAAQGPSFLITEKGVRWLLDHSTDQPTG
jgi:hypothetical protein